VQAVLGAPFGEIGRDEAIGELVRRFKEERALLVRDSGGSGLLGLLTRHDLLAYLSERGGERAV
jgi:predicted transcriptional regulator